MAERFEVGRRDLRKPIVRDVTDVWTVHDRAASRFAIVNDKETAERIVGELRADPNEALIYVWRDCDTEEALPRLAIPVPSHVRTGGES